jgi:probable HAF family extracellular repeat protein
VSQVAPYSLTDLGTLGGTRCDPRAVNDRGQVVGVSSLRDGTSRAFRLTPLDTNADGKPDVWNRDLNGDGANDLMQALPSPKGSWSGSTARAINNLGQVCGVVYSNSGRGPSETAVTWSAAATGAATLLGKAGDGSGAQGINDAGQIVGWKQGPVNFVAVLWQLSKGAYTATALPIPSGYAGSRAVTINNSGQVAGTLADGDYAREGFKWTAAGGTQRLGKVPGQDMASWDQAFINDRGEVAVTAFVEGFPTPTLSLPQPAYGLEAGIHSLGYPATGLLGVMASGFNNLGQVTTWADGFNGFVGNYLWQDGLWQDFGALAAVPAGATLGTPSRPSNNGYIAGAWVNGQRISGYLLAPN